ncbi:hypothetical protein [Paenibacillus sp. P13VS]|uniref:hypothetical protein n=1 Tax=Paenibacillus sp. P13VS TaxID=2697367 RepID=UPI00187B26F4|nr:hypothetical protein [Paenibacillus sp. P13VS]MBE7681487.1 hypothetical protein [Paenibacillus sp. P13VS]
MKINTDLWQQVSFRWVRQMSVEQQEQIEQTAAESVTSVLQELELKGTADTIRSARDEVLFLISQDVDDDDDDFI